MTDYEKLQKAKEELKRIQQLIKNIDNDILRKNRERSN